jgi:hypothetical protein
MAEDRSSIPVLSYATPAALDKRDVWRDGNLIIKPAGLSLPMRCVKCNSPDVRAVRMNFRYSPSLRLVAQAYHNIAVPLCRTHRAMMRSQWWISIGIRSIGTMVMFSPAAMRAPGPINAGSILAPIVIGVSMLYWGGRMNAGRSGLRLTRVARGDLYFAGAGNAYLESLSEPTIGIE